MADDDAGSDSLIRGVEARLRQAETFAWSVPAVIVAAHAFLLPTGLAADAYGWRQRLPAIAGIAIVVAGLHFMWKHAFNFDVYEAVLERELQRRDLPSPRMRPLLASLRTDPPPPGDLGYRRWAGSRWRTTLVTDRRTLHVWTAAFLVLLAVDCVILSGVP